MTLQSVSSLDELGAWLFVLIGIGLFALGLWAIITGFKIRAAEEDTVADAAAGEQVDLEGTAHHYRSTLKAPVSNRSCLGYSYTVKEYNSGDGSRWRTIDSGSETVPFVLQTDDGSVLVDDTNPSLAIGNDEDQVTVSAGETPPRSIRQFHEESDAVDRDSDRKIDLGIPWSNGRAKRRYIEHALLQNNTAYVSGTGYDPDQVSVEVPDKADAVIGSSNSFGRRRLLRSWLSPLSFYVTDSPMDEAAAGTLQTGIRIMLFGLMVAGLGGLPLWISI